MVDCRSLIEFCKAFEHHKNMADSMSVSENRNHSRARKRSHSLNPLSHPFCDRSAFAAVDCIILILVVGALGFLIIPYLSLIFRQGSEILPVVCDLVGEVIDNAPVAYVVGLAVAFTGIIATIAAWEIIDMKSRKCGNPNCKGLRKAIEFDIQLESEECVKYLPMNSYAVKPLELGQDHKELEAELKRMAPLNGRTVLIFRAPCGCPAGRLEVWGPKKIRRIKK